MAKSHQTINQAYDSSYREELTKTQIKYPFFSKDNLNDGKKHANIYSSKKNANVHLSEFYVLISEFCLFFFICRVL